VEERAGTAFNAQNLANIAWAFATAGVPAPRLYATIAQQAEERIGIFTAQNLANIAWAFAKADVSAPRLYAAIAQEAEARVSEFKAQELANIVWAFATAGVSAPRLFATIAQQAEARAGAFNAQSLANTAWAFATAGVRAPRLYAAIARQVEEHADTFTAQGLANTVWAFAKAGVNAPRLYAAIAQQAEKRAGTFNVQNLANTAWAFATAGVSAPRLYAAIAQQVEACVHTCRAQELANIAWAFATAGVSAPRLYAAISQQAEERVETFNAQDLANTASALSTSAVLQEPWPSAPPCTRISPLSPERHRVVLSLVEQWLTCGSLSAERTSSEMSAIERALLACDVCMRAERSPADAADRMRVAELRRQARELSSCFDIEQLVTESAMQRELSTRLAAAGWAHADEVPLADGLLIVDMACEKTRVVVEIDGPTHYLRDVSSGEETYNGSTRVKTRLLRLLGWRVIRVGWREWARGPDARELLVQRLLARCRIRTDV
jgi:very-short-patch-repair endonuclease